MRWKDRNKVFSAALAILQFFLFGILVGRARAEFGIKAPATSGHELFERA